MTPSHLTPGREDPVGSSSGDEPVFLAVGRLRRPHGLRGEMQMDVLTDFPERLRPGMELYIGPDYVPHKLRSLRWHGRSLLVSFDGYDTPEEAGKLRNQTVFVTSADRPALEEGEYYHHELLGLRVVAEDGEYLGVLNQILETGANDVYVVAPESGREILLPATDEVILDVNLREGLVRVHLLPGLLNE